MLKTIQQTADYLTSKISEIPNTAIILAPAWASWHARSRTAKKFLIQKS